MDDLKLFLVYHLGASPCWNLRIASSQEAALMQCFDQETDHKPADSKERSCRVEEVTFEGYRIKIEKE
jgi:hypothetical protein